MPVSAELRAHVADMTAGDHVCLLYQSREELAASAAAFFAAGAGSGDCCVYVGEPAVARRVDELLATHGIDAAALRADGALRTVDAADIYLIDGGFDADVTVARMRELVADTLRAGCGRIRIVADTIWAMPRPELLGALADYEARVCDMLRGSRVLALCAYDRDATPPDMVRRLLTSHPTVAIGADVCSNPFFEPTGLRDDADGAARLEWSLSRLTALRADAPTPRSADDAFLTLAEHAPDIIARFDLELRHLYVNRRVEEVTGRPRSDFIGRTNAELDMPADLVHALREASESVIRTRSGVTVDFEYTGPGGRHFMQARFAPEFDAEGAIVSLLCITRDLTRERHALEQGRRAEARYARLFEAMAQGVIYHATDGSIRDVNPAAERILGITEADLRMRPLDAATWRAVRDDGSPFPIREHPALVALETGREVNGVVAGVFNPVRAQQRWILLHAHPELDEAGAVVGAISTFTDITPQRWAEQRLRDSESRFRLMVEGSEAVFFYVHDEHGRFEYVSPSVSNVLGYRPFEMISRRYHDFVDEADIAEVERATLEALSTGTSMPSYRGRLRHRDGRVLTLEMTEAPVTSAGRVTGVRGFARDITERVAMEDARNAGEAQLRAVLDTAPIAIIMVGADRRVRLWNRAAETLFGWTAAEIVGEPYPIVAPADETATPEQMFAACETGQSYHGAQIRRLTRTGDTRELRFWNARLFDAGGQLTGMVGIFVDNTGRNRLEAELRQSQKIEAIGRLAGGVAHDFNNVLTSILGHADLVSDALDPRDPLREDLGEIRASAERARGLTRQLLAFSRKQVLSPEVLDLRVVIGDMQRMLTRLIGEDVLLSTEIDDALWHVRADRSQIEQVLLNLAVNARDALPDGGHLTIRAANVPRAASAAEPTLPRADWVLLEVADTGTGIEPSLLDQVFEPFFTTKPPGKGTGLGLPTVYGVVAQSGGHIRVDSEVGRGTTFRIYLPRSLDALTPAPRPARQARAEPRKATILLVEDEPGVRSLATRIFMRHGYRVIAASNGEEALLAAERHAGEIEVVVSDLVMPGISGRELVDRLQATYPALGVVLMSGYSEELLTERGGLRPTEEFLAKPFTVSSLLSAVQHIVDLRASTIQA